MGADISDFKTSIFGRLLSDRSVENMTPDTLLLDVSVSQNKKIHNKQLVLFRLNLKLIYFMFFIHKNKLGHCGLVVNQSISELGISKHSVSQTTNN